MGEIADGQRLSTWAVLRRALAPYRLRILALSALMLGASSLEGAGIGLFYPLLEYVQHGEGFLQHRAARPAVALMRWAGLAPSVGLFISLISLVILAALLLKYGVSMMSPRIYNPVMRDLRDESFRKVLSAHVFFFIGGSSAQLAQIVESEVDDLGAVLGHAVIVARCGLSILVFGACALAISWRLTALVALLAALRYAVSGPFLRRIQAHGRGYGFTRQRLKSLLYGAHQGIAVIKSFATEDDERRRFEGVSAKIERDANAIEDAKAAGALVEGLLGDGLLCALVYVAVSRIALPGTALLTLLFIVTRIIPKAATINSSREQLVELLARVNHLPRVLADGGLPALRWGRRRKAGFDDRVVFEDVSFRYPAAGHDAVSRVDLTLERRGTLALVGESGAGKTTLARLLLRLFDPTSGRITVDGVPLAELRREDWTRLVGVVGQDAFVFEDTLENNVRYGAPGCTDAEFREALRRARAAEFVERLPLKEKTPLGERGVRLSGGQRQRIALARAFLRNPPILILDEATSALDSVTESLIQQATDELASDRSVLVIAHRLSTVRGAGRIVVLESGRVVESGTHAELIARRGRYRRFHELQTA